MHRVPVNEAFITLMEDVKLVPPGAVAAAIIDSSGQKRTVPKDLLKKIEDMCAWCGVVKVLDKRRKYCSPSCSHSSSCHFYPQSNAPKAFLLVHRQSCACAGCGLSFEDELVDRLKKIHTDWNSPTSYRPKPTRELVTWWRLAYNTGHLWHVDHIVPLHQGGQGIGLENIQILCVKCHFLKSADERRR